MKVPNVRDLLVYAQPLRWAIASDDPELLSGAHMLTLNSHIEIRFVPEVSELAPPWDALDFDPATNIESRPQARVWATRTSDYTVTPNSRLAGTAERIPLLPPANRLTEDSDRGVVWYVDTRRWAVLTLELEHLCENTNPFGHFVALSALTGTHLWHFLTERFITSDFLARDTAEMLREAR